MTLGEMMSQMMADRGLTLDAPRAAEVEQPQDQTPQELPWDYEARAEALRCAITWCGHGAGVGYVAQEQTLQRALDFHAFLIGKETTDGTDGCDD